ncbi:transcription antitermination factor NusB [Polycladidibacter hongkongensis]|uniref:transcription antitermination factor NusB n=1 Tax=Polycladidibacter hongkongensis TaxID=1647556 RepID=UPI00082BC04F|nr:transcription antitermination factor NusB [Pseudovibrio hongkongensis]
MEQENNKGAKAPRLVNKRGAARLAAVQAVYQLEVGGSRVNDVVSEFEVFRLGQELDGEKYRDADAAWFRDLVQAVFEEQKIIDPKLHSILSQDWPLKRVDATLRSILRVAYAELLRKKDVPAKVIINEFIEITKAFYDQDEPKLVNGLLNRLARDVRADEFDA